MKRALLLAALLFLPAQAQAVEYFKVIDVSGSAEVQPAGSERWQPLAAPRLLSGGDKVRTAAKSYVEFASDPGLSTLMLLSADSLLEVMGDDRTRFFLRRGGLSFLREEDVAGASLEGPATIFQIFTADLIASLPQGGLFAGVYSGGTLLKVFSEEVRVEELDARGRVASARTVGEGFKFSRRAASRERAEPLRMPFADYENWQRWARRCYKRKDDLAQATVLKG